MNKFVLQLSIILLSWFSIGYAVAQPVITSIEKKSNSMTEVVSIKGNGFGAVKADLAVFFGGAKAVINFASDQLLEVQVPFGATYDHVSVTRAGLTGYSNDKFLLSFGGSSPFTQSNLDAQIDFPALPTTINGLSDLCMCDFDGDNDLDIVTANKESLNLTLFKNISTPGSVVYAVPTTININANSLRIKCGDLNGDGSPDIVATGKANGKVFVLQNDGAGNFVSITTISMPITQMQQVKIGDLDADGKPDLIITHDQQPARISILKNTTAGATVSFSSPNVLSVVIPNMDNNIGTEALDVIDLNGDNKLEIIISRSGVTASGLLVIETKVTGGVISFNKVTEIKNGGNIISGGITNIRTGDLDGDGKPDIAVPLSAGSNILIFKNQSSASSISFANPVSFSTDKKPFGLDFGDLDGDGKTDIVATCLNKDDADIGGTVQLTILNNTSSAGSISFNTPVFKATGTITRHVSIGDIDGDGKPDLAFTSIDDDPPRVTQRVSVFRNNTCMVPVITPSDPLKLTVCKGSDLKLYSSVSGGAKYNWFNTTGAPISVGTNSATYTVDTSVPSVYKYKVTVNPQPVGSPATACPSYSNEVTVNVTPGLATLTPIDILPTGPICIGDPLQLEVADLGPGLQYKWTGPDYSYSGPAFKPTVINSFQPKDAGRYFVEIIDQANSNCIKQRGESVIEGVNSIDFRITVDGSSVFCEGTKKLTISPNPAGAKYEWFRKPTNLDPATSLGAPSTVNSSYLASTSGFYSAKVIITGCNTANIPDVKLIRATTPVPDFTLPPNGCKDEAIQFINNTPPDADPDAVMSFTWKDDTGTLSTVKDPNYIFTDVKTYHITLTASYQDNACEGLPSASIPINITTESPISIFSTLHPDFSFCKEGGEIALEVAGSFSSILWSNSSAESVITLSEAGDYSVSVKKNSCTLKDTVTVKAIVPVVTAIAEPTKINEGESTQLTATGLVDYTWSPDDGSLSDLHIPNPIASPIIDIIKYEVTGKDINNCTGSASVTVEVKTDPIVSKLKPAVFFSPNGSEPNETWTIDLIDQYQQCKVSIYDNNGVKVFEAKPYNNDWRGTFNDKKLPDGVYYYIIRCDGEENKPKSGSITLLR